jgi:hypothetical protein
MTGGALLSVFWASETVADDEKSATQHKSRRTGLEDIWILLCCIRLLSIIERYITAPALTDPNGSGKRHFSD